MREKTLRTLEFDKVLNKIKDFACSEIAKQKIDELKPSISKLEIEDALKKLSDASYLLNIKGFPDMTLVMDIRADIHRAAIGGNLSISALYDTMNLLDTSSEVNGFYKDIEEKNTIKELAELVYVNKSLLNDLKNAILDRETISDSATQKLASLNRKRVNLNDSIGIKLKEYVTSQKNSKYLQDAIVTVRDGRYVIPVKREYKNFVKGIVHDVSGSGGTYFIEPEKIVNLNNEIRVVENEIEEEKRRIIKELSNRIGAVEESLIYNIELISEIDFVFAKARFGTTFGYSIPNFSEKFELDLRQVFHPLIDDKKVVRTDVMINENTRALIITGPNTGGKTVILKTVGLIVLLGQSGCMIPASEESKLPIFEEVFTDIGDEQSVEQSLSTFSSHMTNIIEILNYSRDKSLYLFDELGAGTDPIEGAALAMAIIDELVQNNVKMVVSTHYAELKIYAMQKDGVVNGSMQFSVETLKPTYKLQIGIPGRSNAFEISKKLGLDDAYIEKAKNYVDDNSLTFENVLEEIEINREKINKLKQDSLAVLNEANKIRKEAKEYAEKKRYEANDIIEKAKEQSVQIYNDAKSDYENLIKEAKIIINNVDSNSARQIQETRSHIRNKIDKLSQKKKTIKSNLNIEDIIPGMTLRIISLNQIGTAIDSPDADGNVQLQVGILKVNSNVNDLEIASPEKEQVVERKKYRVEKSKYIRPEIDLRGVDQEELYDRLDKYLDDAFIAGLKEITIVHGKGTGALRKATESMLKKNEHVESFRLGKVGEGDTGVTIVKLK